MKLQASPLGSKVVVKDELDRDIVALEYVDGVAYKIICRFGGHLQEILLDGALTSRDALELEARHFRQDA